MSDPLAPHRHDPNPHPPGMQTDFTLHLPTDRAFAIRVKDLWQLPISAVSDCYIVSTGHGTSGPFIFRGVYLQTFLESYGCSVDRIGTVEVIGGDGFGTRIYGHELATPGRSSAILLALECDGQPLTRAQGLVRLVVPSETDDALRQVKWIERIQVREAP